MFSAYNRKQPTDGFGWLLILLVYSRGQMMHYTRFFVSWLCFFVWGGAGCTQGGQVRSEKQKTLVLSLQKLSCEGCGKRIVRVLKRKKGIQKLRFDKHRVELHVSYHTETIGPASIKQTIEGMGFTALAGRGKGRYKPSAQFPATMDVKWIAKKGEKVSLKEHLAVGKVTVFDFYAVWCGPCKDVDHALLGLLKKYKKLALRKINVVDWKSPVSKVFLRKVSQLPYLVIFDKNGKQVKTLVGRKIKELQQTIATLAK
jgi:thiol-disulfide isomerase/thioredoxin